MLAGIRKEVIVREIYADQTNPLCTHMDRQAHCQVRRIPCVVHARGVGKVDAAKLTKPDLYDVWMANRELQLSEQHLRLAVLNKAKAIAVELLFGVEDNKIVGLEHAPDVVYPDGDAPIRICDLAEGSATPAYENGLSRVEIPKLRQSAWKRRERPKGRAPSRCLC